MKFNMKLFRVGYSQQIHTRVGRGLCQIAFTLYRDTLSVCLTWKKFNKVGRDLNGWVLSIFPCFPKNILLVVKQSRDSPHIPRPTAQKHSNLGSIFHEHFSGLQPLRARRALNEEEALIALQKGKHREEKGVYSC